MSTESEHLFASEVFQKAMIEVNEEGSEAAAATALLAGGAPPSCKKTIEEFILNRPFLWTIVHLETNVPLFHGKFVNPK